MKTKLSPRSWSRLTLLSALFAMPGILQAQTWRLVGITGQQGDTTPDGAGGYLYPDHTLYEINTTTGAITKLFKMTFVNDSQAIGFCPSNGLLYHMAGSQSYTNDPSRNGHDQGGPNIAGVGYQDSHYMESVNVRTQVKTGVFNADPCPNPEPLLPCFGLPAPRPSWVLPVARRTYAQTDATFSVRGPNEYGAARGMAWSKDKNLFYITDDAGIFKLTNTGDCTFLARPAFPSDNKVDECKAIAFVTTGGTTKLLVGHRNGTAGNKDGILMEIDPETGSALGEIPLAYPAGGGAPSGHFGGLLGMEQHPVTGVIYAIRKIDANNFARELVTIDLATGATTLVGNMGMHVAGIAFVQDPAFEITSVSRTGNDITLTWSGGTPPYQVQSSTDMTAPSWTNLGAATNGTSTTVTVGDARTFLRVNGQ